MSFTNGISNLFYPVGLFSTVVLFAQSAAQAIPGVDSGVGALIGTVGTGAVLVWYVVYDVRTRTPAMLASFAAEQAAMRLAFTQEQAAIRTAFSTEQEKTHQHYNSLVESLRQTFIQEQNAARHSFSAEQSAVRQRHDQELSEMRGMLFENMKSMRGAVHDIKDTANGLILKKALQDQTQEQQKP
ncbi:hypothetical protein NA78x_001752 [Anatilimnocola sp. NA78]|uniref:hypothetical protein n=1 Tax=Anatilimnocola sp. NA78 TaxID=3415683 RepID=UPI003CE44FAF